MSDFPYPVGRAMKVYLPSRKDRIASSYFNYNDATPIMGGSRGYWGCNPPMDFSTNYVFLRNLATTAVNLLKQ